MDGAAPDTRLNAQRKAYTAARSDARTTEELAEKVRDDPVERASFDPFFTFFLGGVAAFDGGRQRRRRRRERAARRGRRRARSRRRSSLPGSRRARNMPHVGNGQPVQIGVGMLGYAFMGKAHSRALRALRELDPPLLPELVSISGRNREALEAVAARFGWAEAVDRLARAGRRRPDRALRQRRPERDPRRAVDRRARGGQARPLREAARPRRRRVVPDLAGGDGAGTRARLRLQLPLRPGDPARPRAARGGRGRRDRPLPRALPAVVGLGRGHEHLALRPRPGGDGSDRRPRHAHHRPGPVPRRRDRDGLRDRCAPTCPGTRSTTRSRPRSSSRTARSARSRRRGSRAAASTRPTCEINGSEGSIAFDMERFDELQVSDGGPFRTERVTGDWWPPGHLIGWGDTFTLEYARVISSDRRRDGRRSVLRDVRGRLPRHRGLRRDRCAPPTRAAASRSPTGRSERVRRADAVRGDAGRDAGRALRPSQRADRAGGGRVRRDRPAAPRSGWERRAARRRARLLDARGVHPRREPLPRGDRRTVRRTACSRTVR